MKKILLSLFILSILFLPDILLACATCFGDPNAAATQGMNKAIITMLGITGGVLSGVGSSIYILNKRSKKYYNSLSEKNQLRSRD
ncbi:MAG: hypothetical protein VX517_00800 [Candidatus Neomarinimicrobiota bacterium]|nr:hypothetical protein [Candidatus Neomarinimicrobiota bacterium]